jgi:hypothetical protein
VAIIALGFGFVGCDDDNGKTEKQTPVADDFDISGIGTFDYDGTAKTVTITPKPNKSTGEITVYYNGSVTAPIPINTYSTYSVTFDVAETEGFNAKKGLIAGTLVINPVPVKQPYSVSATSRDGNSVNVEINYVDLPDTVPDYIFGLEEAIKGLFSYKTAEDNSLVIDVIATGVDGFVKTGPKTLSVRKSWLLDAMEIEYEIEDRLSGVLSSWLQ